MTKSTIKAYFTLVCREDGVWSPQFGDYNRDVVIAERDHYKEAGTYKAKDMVIIKTPAETIYVNARIAELNKDHKTD